MEKFKVRFADSRRKERIVIAENSAKAIAYIKEKFNVRAGFSLNAI